jgi:hypothetical protein
MEPASSPIPPFKEKEKWRKRREEEKERNGVSRPSRSLHINLKK